MKKMLLFVNILFFCCLQGQTVNFDEFFEHSTLRIDYFQTGDRDTEIISFDQFYLYPYWSGNPSSLVDDMNLGQHKVEIYDSLSGKLIFLKGYSSIFAEWQTTDEAVRGYYRSFSASILIPLPKNSFKIVLYSRNRMNQFVEVFSTYLNPSRMRIREENLNRVYKSKRFWYNGNPEKHVDIVILPEGYTKKEMKKFRSDVKHFIHVMFSLSPYRENREKFSIYYVIAPSPESGIDIPEDGKYSQSLFDFSYGSFGISRYVLSFNNKMIRDVASVVPYDQIYVIVNSPKYGGGGIFNLYAVCYNKYAPGKSSNLADYVFLHEFGHTFGGLADEYYSSKVAYNEFYPPGVEPWEPNITALLVPENLKWKHLVEEATPIPTPWEKARYDSAPDPARLRNERYWGKVGAFEGAGYSSKGLYRPYLDCIMFSRNTEGFCPVCREAIQRMIDYYTK